MFKCKNCGNTEKFIGVVSEKGNAFIYQNNDRENKSSEYSWAYCISDNCWSSNFKIRRCGFCRSRRIAKIQTIKN